MKVKITTLIIICLFMLSCNNSKSEQLKEKELQLKEKELNLKEKELKLDELQKSNTQKNKSTNSVNFSGKWSSEGDIKAEGLIVFEIQQDNSKIIGICSYSNYENSESTGILSLNGYVKNNIAYIRLRDSKLNIIADGTLKLNDNVITFNQTTSSNWLPKVSYAYKSE